MKIPVFVAGSLLVLFAGMLIFTQLGWNLLGSAIFREYEIPAQSSIFTFKATDWFKEGSGDLWTYGEDGLRFYYWDGSDAGGYKTITRTEAAETTGFSSTNHLTWKK